MNETVDIKKLSDIEIKALAYDELARLEMCQNNLKVLNQELQSRNTRSTSLDRPISTK
jgi:hypothetical protein